MSMTVSAIVAMAENNCIGKDNQMPWHIPEDLKRFKERTMGGVIIMGRKTFESILGYLGKPLPGRISIVVSRSGYTADGAITCPDMESAIEKAKELAAQNGQDEIFIGGGAQIYELAMPHTNKLYLTKVHRSVEGDTFFPALGEEWNEIANEDFEGDPSFSIKTLVRAG